VPITVESALWIQKGESRAKGRCSSVDSMTMYCAKSFSEAELDSMCDLVLLFCFRFDVLVVQRASSMDERIRLGGAPPAMECHRSAEYIGR